MIKDAKRISFKKPGAKDWSEYEMKDDTRDESREALNGFLLTSLQMQNLVVLAGCGTSLGSAGGPSMKDLWDSAVGSPISKEANEVAKKIGYTLGSNNIEDFLSHAEAFFLVSNDKTVEAFVNSCKKAILKKCSTFLGQPGNTLDAHKTLLHRLSRRRIRDPRLRIYTTNYDRCYEEAASLLGCVVVDGFSFTSPRYYDPRFFDYDIIRRPRTGEDQGSFLEGVFHLHKLHGSVNWAHVDGVIREKADPSPEEACLIYPARRKYQQSFLPPHLESMSQYLTSLREPNTCLLVSGFGFNDDHLSEPILAAVRSNPHLRLVIADPSVKEMESNEHRYWKELFNRCREGDDICFVEAKFQDFVLLIPDLLSLTPADKLMKAVRSAISDK